MTRILALTNWYPPHHYGGYELSCFDVLTRLEERGHDVLVLCSDQRLPGIVDPDTPHEAGVRRRLRLYIRDGDKLVSPPLRTRWAIERHNQDVLRAAIDEFSPDVVAVWHMGAMSLGLLTALIDRGVPLVYAVCDDWLLYEPVHNDAWARLFERSALRRWMGLLLRPLLGVPTTLPDLGASGAFCFVSDATRRAAERHSPWAFQVAAVVYSGIDTRTFRLDAPAADRAWRWRMLYAGRFDPRKGTETLVRALSLLPQQATLAMYGRGGDAERSRLVELAAQLGVGDRVTFGQLDREQLPERYAGSDVFVFPVEWDEPFGLAPVEAMACGTPVVATGRGGSGEFLQDGVNSVLFRSGDPAALAAAVTRLHDDEPLRRSIIEGGFVTAQLFDIERLTDRFEQWYDAAAGGFRSGHPRADLPDIGAARSSEAGDGLTRHRQATVATVTSGDAAAIKRLYVDMGTELHEAFAGDPGGVPVLSSSETHPVVAGLLEASTGLVLDAGCGPNPAVASAIAAGGCRTVVALDIGLGTVQLARAGAARRDVSLLGVVGDLEHLPFRGGAFDALACDDTIEHVPDDRKALSELARVLRRSGRAVLATPNRHDADVLRRKLRDLVRARRRSRASYYAASSHLREYTWAEFEKLVAPNFEVTRRAAVGWERGWKGRIATRLVNVPTFRRFSHMIVIEARPR